MRIEERQLRVSAGGDPRLREAFDRACRELCGTGEAPLRFVVTRSDRSAFECECDVLCADADDAAATVPSIFEFRRRQFERQTQFTAVLVIPTGIGAVLGGHAGDANALARYLASACDTLVTHPNVVNASDVNELPANGVYVEGSLLSRMLMGACGLRRVRANRILLVLDRHAEEIMMAPLVNAASTARTTLGADIVDVIAMRRPVRAAAEFSPGGRAVGRVDNLRPLLDLIADRRAEFDALALASVIDFPEEEHKKYLDARGDMVNPWGGPEAMLTHALALCADLPCAHAPMLTSSQILAQVAPVVDPRMAAEELSCGFIHCVLKGLQRAPQIVDDPALMLQPDCLAAEDVNCLVIPDRCLGLPVLAALEQGITVIAVRENRSNMNNDLELLPFARGQLVTVDNYVEAAGVMQALKAGVTLESIRRPLTDTGLSQF